MNGPTKIIHMYQLLFSVHVANMRPEATIGGLKPGQDYQFRAIVKHPKLRIRGDHKRVKAK